MCVVRHKIQALADVDTNHLHMIYTVGHTQNPERDTGLIKGTYHRYDERPPVRTIATDAPGGALLLGSW